jgi:protein-S-isoprenylcysteine O-methyltransferase Ste14
METVFMVLLVGLGLFGFFFYAPVLFVSIEVVIPIVLTIAVIAFAARLLWRVFPESPDLVRQPKGRDGILAHPHIFVTVNEGSQGPFPRSWRYRLGVRT